MEPLLSQLAALLRREIEQYRALLAALAEESQRLTANDTDGLLTVTRRKDTLALQIRSLEESRYLLTEKIARALNRKPADLTLRAMCEAAPAGPARDELTAAREELKTAVERVSLLNDTNRRLVENSLRLLQGTMEAIQGQLRRSAAPPKGYGPPRPRASAPMGGFVVAQRA